jgi:Asp-tRNA(Asn)/Glu-tRNA(Gln) amidotransferase C subunit
MDKDKELEQLLSDFDKIMNLFKKMENSSLEDVESLKEESTLLQKELKDRYAKEDSTETDSPEA